MKKEKAKFNYFYIAAIAFIVAAIFSLSSDKLRATTYGCLAIVFFNLAATQKGDDKKTSEESADQEKKEMDQ